MEDPYNLPTVHHKKTGLGHAQSVHTLCFGEENFFGEEIRDWKLKLALGVKKIDCWFFACTIHVWSFGHRQVGMDNFLKTRVPFRNFLIPRL